MFVGLFYSINQKVRNMYYKICAVTIVSMVSMMTNPADCHAERTKDYTLIFQNRLDRDVYVSVIDSWLYYGSDSNVFGTMDQIYEVRGWFRVPARGTLKFNVTNYKVWYCVWDTSSNVILGNSPGYSALVSRKGFVSRLTHPSRTDRENFFAQITGRIRDSSDNMYVKYGKGFGTGNPDHFVCDKFYRVMIPTSQKYQLVPIGS